MTLTQRELDLVAAIGFDPTVGEVVKTAALMEVERLKVPTGEGGYVEIDGLSVKSEQPSVEDVLKTLREQLPPLGYQAYRSLRRETAAQEDEIVILKITDDPYLILRLMKTAAPNFDLTTEDIIVKFMGWQALCRFEVIGASWDWVELAFETLPEDLTAFAQDAYAFCPDIVDQGFGVVEELEAEPEDEDSYDLLSDEMRRQIEAVKTHADEVIHPSLEMGVLLLAGSLEESKALFLWWD